MMHKFSIAPGLGCFLFLSFASHASGAGLQIGSLDLRPGQSAEIAVDFQGDGKIVGYSGYLNADSARLALPPIGTILPSAAGYICKRISETRIVVISESLTSQPLPANVRGVCRIPLRIPAAAVQSTARVVGLELECSDAIGRTIDCTIKDGLVRIAGPIPKPAPELAPAFADVFVLLSNAQGAPTVEQLAAFDFRSDKAPPLVSLAQFRPLAAYSLLHERASGAALRYLQRNPETSRARLERYVVLRFPLSTPIREAFSAIERDVSVQHIHYPIKLNFAAEASAPAPTQLGPVASPPVAKLGGGAEQYHLAALNVAAGHTWAGGWSLIGVIDSGLETEHPDLRSQDGAGSAFGNRVIGGNFLPAYSLDFGRFISPGNMANIVDANVDEREPVPAVGSAALDACDTILGGLDDGFMQQNGSGHGTHVAGTVASNSANADGYSGVCKNCGVGMWKIAASSCDGTPPNVFVRPRLNFVATPTAVSNAIDTGTQVVNASFGGQALQVGIDTMPVDLVNACSQSTGQTSTLSLLNSFCLTINYARQADVIFVAAAGNNQESIMFPARAMTNGAASGVVSAGGSGVNGAAWDFSPDGSIVNCPFGAGGGLAGTPAECGTNITQATVGEKRQEGNAPAVNIRAPIYTGQTWNADIQCGDIAGADTVADGFGNCTGTSMAAPQIAGVFGLLRSINPLVPAGDPEIPAMGLRMVVRQTSNRAQQNLPWNNALGYGRPDLAAAARRVLGTVLGQPVKNRAIPLFRLYSQAANDYAAVTSPQGAMALIRNTAAGWVSSSGATAFLQGALVPGYSTFPRETGAPIETPRASAYVLSTEFAPATYPNAVLTPLYFLDRARPDPIGCTGGPNCNLLNRDFVLLTSSSEVNIALSGGYRYRGLQGYVFSQQQFGTQALYLRCRPQVDDCAVFLESEAADFDAQGYQSSFVLGNPSGLLGYAFGTTNSDADLLPDALERVIGTSVNHADSDADGFNDSVEFPLAQIAESDPCSGNNTQCNVLPELIFANGLEN